MHPGQLFTRRDAIAAGDTDRDLATLVRAGHITRVARGVYRTGITPVGDPEAVARSMKVALSHTSAGAWYGASLLTPPDRLHVTAPRSRGRRSDEVAGVCIHRADLPRSDLVSMRGTPVTSPVRTALDLARLLPPTEAVAALDSMCRLGIITAAEVQRAAAGLPPARGRRRAVTAAELVDARAESVFESISRVMMLLAGLPAPVPQLNIYAPGGAWIARVDFAWPRLRVILECDGFEYHGSRTAFHHDRRRWSALTRAGWRVVVVTWADLLESPGYLIELMSDLLG